MLKAILAQTENLDSKNSTENYADFYPKDLRNLEKTPDYQNFYTPDLIKSVRERYRIDIERFDYQFN